MTEIRMVYNPLTHPHLAAWEWHIALYLFLGGLVAGLMILSGGLLLTQDTRWQRLIRLADLWAPPLLVLGLFLLWLDLANGWNAHRFYLTFKPISPMSWGSWVLLLCLMVLAARWLTHLSHLEVWASREPVGGLISRLWRAFAALRLLALGRVRWLAWANLVLGSALGLYTGILLGTMVARPMWNSAVLGPLFLISGLATGVALLCLFATHEELQRLTAVELAVSGAKGALIFVYVLALVTGPAGAQASARLLLNGEFALAFWLPVVIGGTLFPVLVKGAEMGGRPLTWIPPAALSSLALVGGLALRWVIVYGGQLTSF